MKKVLIAKQPLKKTEQTAVMDDTVERRLARIVWESLEQAADHLTPGHPAELSIRRALKAAEEHWRTLHAVPVADDRVLLTDWRRVHQN
jgi:hypothetical protein